MIASQRLYQGRFRKMTRYDLMNLSSAFIEPTQGLEPCLLDYETSVPPVTLGRRTFWVEYDSRPRTNGRRSFYLFFPRLLPGTPLPRGLPTRER